MAACSGGGRIATRAWARLAVLSGLVLALLLGLAGTARALPGAELAPIRGMAYQPAPSDYTGSGAGVYYDSDFFNDDFNQLWSAANGGRGDLQAMATQLRVNFLHLYDWNPVRNHLAFMNEAYKNGIRIAVPISNYFVDGSDPNAAAHIEQIVRQVYVDTGGNPAVVPHPAVVMWTIANEYDLNPITAAQVATATQYLVAAEQAVGATTVLPVSVPVSFGIFPPSPDPAVSKTLEAIAALEANPALGNAFVSSRFVAATNPQNPGSYITQWLPKFTQQVPNTMLWFSELGTAVQNSCNGYPTPPCTADEQQQAVFNADQWAASTPGTQGILLGGAQFEFLNEDWKTGTEATFGVYKFATPNNYREVPTAGGTYRVDQLVQKPSWSALQKAFGGSGFGGPGGGVGGGPGALAGAVAAPAGAGACSPLLSACAGLAAGEPPPPVAPPSSGTSDGGSAVGGPPRMPNLRASATASQAGDSVQVRVRVVATRAQLVRRGFLVRVSIPSLGERTDVKVRLRGDRVRVLVVRLDVAASAIGRRVIVKLDPTDLVLEARERDNGARTRVT